jgi:hypothetical protein
MIDTSQRTGLRYVACCRPMDSRPRAAAGNSLSGRISAILTFMQNAYAEHAEVRPPRGVPYVWRVIVIITAQARSALRVCGIKTYHPCERAGAKYAVRFLWRGERGYPCYQYQQKCRRARPRYLWGIGEYGWCLCGCPAVTQHDGFNLCSRCATEAVR